jgi:hypothetical protein
VSRPSRRRWSKA